VAPPHLEGCPPAAGTSNRFFIEKNLPLDGMILEIIPSTVILPGQLEGETDAGQHRDQVPVLGVAVQLQTAPPLTQEREGGSPRGGPPVPQARVAVDALQAFCAARRGHEHTARAHSRNFDAY
jgi:hypothetical protein